MQKLQVYAVQEKGQFRLGLARNPLNLRDLLLEKAGPAWILTGPAPSYEAYALFGQWKKRLRGFLAPWWKWSLSFRHRRQGGAAEQGQLGRDALTFILELVRGRILTERYLMKALREKGFWPADVSRALDQGVYKKALLQFPGIRRDSWGRLVCNRCNSETVLNRPCSSCGSLQCPICPECSSLGPNRGCTTLIAVPAPAGSGPVKPVSWQFSHQLTRAQRGAARELLKFWHGPQSQALVWAACGAGKTEVSFPLIAEALSRGFQVLFAIPRLDIVKEMAQRLQNAFPQAALAVHHGGRPILVPGNLVVATTHQVLRFYRRFALVILDEVDAFPYQGSEALRFGLKRAMAPGGKLVEMTATPASVQRRKALITIPARFHGHPLPVPQIMIRPLPPWEDLAARPLPGEITTVLENERHPWLIFAPTIASCQAVFRCLRLGSAKKVALCHSQAPQRETTIQQLRGGFLDIVVSTSILERGVNFPGIGVIVLYAHHPIFTRSTLVQMAGRVGRAADAPEGTVLFIGERATAAMREAVQLIQKLNREAAEKGLLL
ncbi:MAG: DEAD/DEAH box helicase family protein [Firmicutes bacterium]|nr:DEAD/DEAH box helicase family protein [Bacillota bacterium]